MASRTIVLCYHRVGTPAQDPLELAVDPELLRAQLGWLSRRAEIVPLTEVLEAARHPRAAITFDDGYADNAEVGLEILAEARAHASVFVTAGYVDTEQRFWWDRLTSIVLQQDLPDYIESEISGKNHWLDVRSETARQRSFWFLHQRLLWMVPSEIERVLDLLEAQLNGRPPTESEGRVVTVPELRRIASHPYCTVGSHTVRHPLLATLDPGQQLEEISTARSRLEAWIEQPVTQFAYPFGGVGAFDRRTVASVRRSGYELACATTAGTVHPRLDRFRIPRYLVRNWDLRTFQTMVDRWLAGSP